MSKSRPTARKTGSRGLSLIREFEGCKLIAYPDPGTGGAPWTIGFGHTGPEVRPGLRWTREQAEQQLHKDVKAHAADVRRAIGDSPTTQAQFDALVSFHFNTGAISRATLTKLHRAGRVAEAAREFGRWRYAGGRVLAGLVRRRAAEAELYLSD